MICTFCHGTGLIIKKDTFKCEDQDGHLIPVTFDVPSPCSECNGQGIINCCEGLRAND